MARIVYGVSGEGSGHSSRAREILRHLEGAGHTVKVVSYDRGYRNLADDFDVFETEGLHIASVDNRVSVVRTFVHNLERLSSGVRRARELKNELFHGFQPDVVLTDFEPMTAYFARHYDLPLVTLDNQHRMRYMRYEVPEHLKKDALVTETVIRLIAPKPDVSLVTTFFFGPLKNRRTFLFPPILRGEVLGARPTTGAHVLVYFTSGFESMVDRLRRYRRERFVVYGTEREGEERNLLFKPPSADGFLADLASARAVIATAGFTLMTESLHLGKPYLALPMAGQFEQELNALLLDELGMGLNGREPGRTTVGEFLYRIPEYTEALTLYRRGDNGRITAKLDELLADDCAVGQALPRRTRGTERAGRAARRRRRRDMTAA